MQQSGTIVNGKSSMNKMPPQSSCFPDWNSGCQTTPGMEPNLSVVTTVWGMTGSSQSGPHSTYAGNGPNNSHNGPNSTTGGVPPNYMKNQPYWNNNANQSTGPSYPPQQRNEPVGAASRQDPNYPNQSPLGVTAMVTAIATATATATASVVALQERQEGNNQYQMNSMPNQYPPYNNSSGGTSNGSNQTQPQRMSSGGVMSSGGINNQKMTMQQGESVYGRSNICRSSPYPTTPPSHINQKRGQTNSGIGPNPSGQVYPGSALPNVPPSFEGMNPYGHPSYQSSGQTNVNPRMMYRGNMRPGAAMPGARSSHVPPYSYPNGQQYYNPNGMHPGNIPQRMGQGVPMSPHHIGLPPGYPHNSYLPHQQPPMTQYSNGPMPSSSYPDTGSTYGGSPYGGEPRPNRSYPHSPIPGNPTPLTPPLTPASSAPPCYNAGHATGDTKPVISTMNESELRLTFPVRDGTILAPFRLEHNLAVSNHVFHLKPTVHQTLTWRSDLELQLKCFHHEDRQMNTNWPASVQVSVNAIPLSIDRGENKISHKPLYLKDICLPGRNTLQITVSACCCSHLFVLQLVHRPSVRSVLQGLLRKRLLPAEHCITKIKRHFNNNTYYGNQNPGSQDGDGVEQTAIKVSLKCPITYKRMSLPARGHDCKHVQCFDLESYLHLNCERSSWRCPVCNKTAQLEGLEVDQYIWSILNALTSSDSEEVTIDSAANWRETTSATGFKTKSETVEPCSAKKAKLISPSEMNMTTWNPDMVMSPYGSPSMHGMSMGQPMNPYGSMSSTWSGSPAQSNSFEFGGDYGPLSRLKESVNSLEALNAMEKSISEQASAGSQGKGFNESSKSDLPYILHTPQTPHTPGTGEHGSLVASSPSHVPNLITSSNHSECDPPNLATLIASDLPSDLNFDPESVINGEGSGQEELNLLPHSGVDPLELLSYLEPSGLATPPSSGDRENVGSNMNSTPDSISDDLLSLFD